MKLRCFESKERGGKYQEEGVVALISEILCNGKSGVNGGLPNGS